MAAPQSSMYSQMDVASLFSDIAKVEEEVETLLVEEIASEPNETKRNDLVRKLVLTSCNAGSGYDAQLSHLLERLFSTQNKDECHYVIGQINAELKVSGANIELDSEVVSSANQDSQGYEVTLSYSKGNCAKKVLLLKGDDEFQQPCLAELTIAGKAYQVIANPVEVKSTGRSGILVVFFENGSSDFVDGGKSEFKMPESLRDKIEIYQRVKKENVKEKEAVDNHLLLKTFQKSDYKNLRELNYHGFRTFLRTLQGTHLEKCTWKTALKEDALLPALRLAIQKGNTAVVIEVLEHIEKMPLLNQLKPKLINMGGTYLEGMMEAMPEMSEKYNQKLAELKTEAQKLKLELVQIQKTDAHKI